MRKEGPKKMRGIEVKNLIGALIGNKRKSNFFSKSGGEVVWDKRGNRYITVYITVLGDRELKSLYLMVQFL